MWWTLLVGCYGNPFAVALDYRIDRTLVPAMRVWPTLARGGVPRSLRALVVSPYPLEEATWEVCGLDTEHPTSGIWVDCFEEPTLVQPVGSGTDTTWSPPELGWSCSNLDSGLSFLCPPAFPLRLRASSTEDEGQAWVDVIVANPDQEVPPFEPLRLDDLTVEVWTGDLRPGAEVTLQATVPVATRDVFRWYVDGGTLLGTGRTRFYDLTDESTVARNVLVVPDDWEGPLRVFVVAELDGQPTWSSITLEIRG